MKGAGEEEGQGRAVEGRNGETEQTDEDWAGRRDRRGMAWDREWRDRGLRVAGGSGLEKRQEGRNEGGQERDRDSGVAAGRAEERQKERAGGEPRGVQGEARLGGGDGGERLGTKESPEETGQGRAERAQSRERHRGETPDVRGRAGRGGSRRTG